MWKLFSHNLFGYLLCFHLFYTDGKATGKPRVNSSPNSELIHKKFLKPTLHPVKFVDAIFPVYKQNKVWSRKSPSLLSTEDFLKWKNEKAIYLGMGDNLYPNFVPLVMYYFNKSAGHVSFTVYWFYRLMYLRTYFSSLVVFFGYVKFSNKLKRFES